MCHVQGRTQVSDNGVARGSGVLGSTMRGGGSGVSLDIFFLI